MPHKDPEARRAWQRDYQSEWTKQNRDKHKRYCAGFIARNKAWLVEYKSSRGCACGERHPACLEFHHPDPTIKDGDPSTTLRRMSIERIERTIVEQGLVVICANCHRKLHWTERAQLAMAGE